MLVHEGDESKGGAPIETLMSECLDSERPRLFDGRDIIPWHRISDFQLMSLKVSVHQSARFQPRAA